MTVLGHWIVIFTMFASAGSAVMYFRAVSIGSAGLILPRRLLRLTILLLSLASLLLLILLLTHDFSNGYVYSYSDRSLPLHYLISTFYAGQEGSFLFWALCSSIIAVVLRRHALKGNLEAWVMTVYMAVVSVFVMLVVAKSPFRPLADMFPGALPGQVPADGHGLNPLLKNFWMVIHPPVLFIGFAAMAAPFSLAIGGLWKRNYTVLATHGFPWVIFGTSVLGLGIMLGAYWAYGVLGWGGYWGWDPVENSSLIPWITGIALLHTMLAQQRTGKYFRTNFALAIVSFLLVVYSTFLTRSGILGDASVHAFTDPGATVYWMLLAFLAAIAVTGGVALWVRRKDLRPKASEADLLTRESSLAAGSLALVLSAIVILFGTSLPIFSTTRVEPSFYDGAQFPVVIAIGLLLAFSLYSQWEMGDGMGIIKRSALVMGVSLALTAALFVLGIQSVPVLIFIFACLFALLANVQIAVKVARGGWRFLGGKLTHIGAAVFLLGVIASGKFSTVERLSLSRNVPVDVLGRTLTYNGYSRTSDGRYVFDVRINDGGKAYDLTPVMYDSGPEGLMRNPDIASTFLKDFYVSPMQFSDDGEQASAETYTLEEGKSVAIGDVQARLVGFDMNQHLTPPAGGSGGVAVGSILEFTLGSDRERITPVAVYNGGQAPQSAPASSRLMNADVLLVGMTVGGGASPSSVTVSVQHQHAQVSHGEVLVVEASVKPLISLVWCGTLVIMLGFAFTLTKRLKEG